MAELGPTLTTERLVLRPPILADFDAFADMMADEDAVRLIGGVQPKAVAWRTLAGLAGGWALLGFGMFCVLERESGRFLGRIGPHEPWGWPGREVGWALIPQAWGRGYAQEAASASLDWAFDHLGWDEAIHCINPANIASAALARRLGSTNRGPGQLPAPNEDTPVDIWAQTAEQWRGRPAARLAGVTGRA